MDETQGDKPPSEGADTIAGCPPARLALTRDGFLHDIETGEIVGHRDIRQSFAVIDDDSAEWVLRLMSEAEADAVAGRKRLEALSANLGAIIKAAESRLKFLHWRFGKQLEEYARGKLAQDGGKSRTARFAWGKVSFRRTPGSVQITDMARAVEWVRERMPDMIRREESVDKADVDELMRRLPTEEWPAWYRPAQPGESATIDTGVGK